MKKYDLLINGQFKDSKHKKNIINPSNGETITEVCMASAKDAKCAIESARNAFDKGSWKDMSLIDRKNLLLKLSEGILIKAKELAELESLNTGKPIKETTFMDIPSAAATFEYFANNLEKYLSGQTQDIQSKIAKVKATLLREPRGVVGLIVPWNYPLLIASWKMAQALAAGNTVILKPSSLTPLTALELANIAKEVGVPNGVINVIPGPGEEVGKILCSDNLVDMISFTGSNAVGKKILEYSTKNVKKLIMELGGKSASIILKDADLEAAVNGSLCSVFLNQGQMCTATSRILVDESIYDNFVSQFVEKAKKIKIGDCLDFQSQIGPLASRFQRDRVISYVTKAKKEGIKLLCGGKIPDDETLKKGFFFEPTIFEGASPESAIFQEEIFGPVVSLNKFSSNQEAVSLANNSSFALAACIWSKDSSKAEELAKEISSGTVWINTYGMFFNELPYGGFKQSGFGKELGYQGFLEYTRLKNVISDQSIDSKPLVNYWYGF